MNTDRTLVRVIRLNGRHVCIYLHEEPKGRGADYSVFTLSHPFLQDPPTFSSIHNAIDFAEQFLESLNETNQSG